MYIRLAVSLHFDQIQEIAWLKSIKAFKCDMSSFILKQRQIRFYAVFWVKGQLQAGERSISVIQKRNETLLRVPFLCLCQEEISETAKMAGTQF